MAQISSMLKSSKIGWNELIDLARSSFFHRNPGFFCYTQHHPLIQAYRLEYRHGCLIFAFTPSLLNVLFLSFFLSQNSSAFIVSKIVNQIITSSNRIIDGCNLVYPFLSIDHHHLILS